MRGRDVPLGGATIFYLPTRFSGPSVGHLRWLEFLIQMPSYHNLPAAVNNRPGGDSPEQGPVLIRQTGVPLA